ncbi:ECF subfamily RNA polymerase sigma-24 factor [Paenibacillus sp. FSL H8-237]|nr:ECF subfamily RNA polymerase sigma-24 factor [Paenibacillus sp. FSL H8-237]
MSGAHDKSTVYPDAQGDKQSFEITYNQYRERIHKYLLLKVNSGQSKFIILLFLLFNN